MRAKVPWSDVIIDVQGPHTRAEGGEQYILAVHPHLETYYFSRALAFGWVRVLPGSPFAAQWKGVGKGVGFFVLNVDLPFGAEPWTFEPPAAPPHSCGPSAVQIGGFTSSGTPPLHGFASGVGVVAKPSVDPTREVNMSVLLRW